MYTPVLVHGGTLDSRNGPTSIWVGSSRSGILGPGLSGPVNQTSRRVSRLALPPDITVSSYSDVGEDGVTSLEGSHNARGGSVTSAGCNSYKSNFGIGSVQLSVLDRQPRNVVADSAYAPTSQLGNLESKGRLSTSRRKDGKQVRSLVLRGGDTNDGTVLGQPVLLVGQNVVGGNLEAEPLGSQKGYTTVTTSKTPDLA